MGPSLIPHAPVVDPSLNEIHFKKPIYAIGEELSRYLISHARSVPLPIAYNDLLRHDGLMAQRDGDGKVVGEKDLETHRNRWIVEKQEFLDARAAAARTLRDSSIDPKRGGRRHPELTGSYLQIHAAELAAKQLRDPQDQKQFVEKVREALAMSVARGEPLPPVRLRQERTPERSRPDRAVEPGHVRL